MPRGPLCCLWLLALTVGLPAPGRAQVAYPPAPAAYRLEIRFDISREDRPLRVRQFADLLANLKAAGFAPAAEALAEDPDLNPEADRLTGSAPPRSVPAILAIRGVANVVAFPEGYAAPADGDAPVRVAVHLRDLRLPDRQRLLSGQALARLRAMGFREGFAYDNQKETLLRGALPAGRLPDLLRDLRGVPDGWFLPFDDPDTRPEPIRSVPPVRWAEVFAGDPPARQAGTPAAELLVPDAVRGKVSPELLRAAAKVKGPLRVTALFDQTLEAPRLRRSLVGIAPDGVVLSVRGGTATVQIPAAAVGPLASIPEVRQLSLTPGFPLPDAPPAKTMSLKPQILPVSLAEPAKVAGLDALHAAGKRGAKVRAAIVAADFNGWEGFVGKGLRSGTRLLDLTKELSFDAKPLPPGAAAVGPGTEAALAFMAAAPEADLTLVRVAPDGVFQLVTLVGALRDGVYASEAIESQRIAASALVLDRSAELDRANAALQDALNEFGDDPESVRRREEARNRVAEVRAALAALTNSQIALAELLVEAQRLRGIDLVVNTLSWDSGVAADGLSDLSRAIDDELRNPETAGIRRLGRPQLKTPLWVQSAGDSAGRVWAGAFVDRDANNVMEFGSASDLGSEFAALGTGGDKFLKAGTRLKASIQWREPHDPSIPEDEYLQPVSRLQLQLVRQVDPEGKAYPSDELDLSAASGLLFTRLATAPNYGVYEGSFEVVLPADGRYLLRVAADLGAGSLPRSRPVVPAATPRVELSPKIVLESSAGVMFAGNVAGGVGSPADARRAVTVGVLGAPRAGAGAGLQLLAKPDYLVPDGIDVGGRALKGPAAASGYAGGVAASLIGAGASTANFRGSLGLPAGSVLSVPEVWRRR